jgi:hypothetical protein
MSNHMPPKLDQLAATKQRRLDALLSKNAEGTISAREKARLETLVAEAEEIMVANARRLADFAKSESPQPPITAVPVTVWVNPQVADH